MKTFLALTGQSGAGKTTVAAEMAARHGFTAVSGSAVLRAANDELPPEFRMPLETRGDMERFQRVWKGIHGKGGLGRRIAAMLQGPGAPDKLCYEGVRNLYDANHVRGAGGVIVALTCGFETRYARALRRTPGLTRNELRRDDALEWESQDAVGLHLRQVMDMADATVDAEAGIDRVVEEIVAALRKRGFAL